MVKTVAHGTKTKAMTTTEHRILLSLHLSGYMGKCGGMSQRERKKTLEKLISEGYLNTSCQVTPKGVEELDKTHNAKFAKS